MANTYIAAKERLLPISTGDGHAFANQGKLSQPVAVNLSTDEQKLPISLGHYCLICGHSQASELSEQIWEFDIESRSFTLIPACIACSTAKDWVAPKFRFDMWPNAGRWDFYNTSKIPSHVGRIVKGRSGEYSAVIFNSSAGYAWLPTLSEAAKWLVEQEST